MKYSANKQINAWHNFVKHHWGFRKTLKIDYNICKIILRNKKVFNRFYSLKRCDKDTRWLFRARVSQKPIQIVVSFRRSNQVNDRYRCYGERGSENTLVSEVKKMKYLSQFLCTFAAFLAKNNGE